ncbi:hypothetical protein NP493_257g03023 [Ridgeia piscesae]|uniref:Uncharacterized protein n=1 Tax=Ridgeia piscesae TaxID=27915 RepID=A0AAD9NY92_RIDPI|nr:hypothetical protein NP493_257g03023 [Ridgeia piscesae]
MSVPHCTDCHFVAVAPVGRQCRYSYRAGMPLLEGASRRGCSVCRLAYCGGVRPSDRQLATHPTCRRRRNATPHINRGGRPPYWTTTALEVCLQVSAAAVV